MAKRKRKRAKRKTAAAAAARKRSAHKRKRAHNPKRKRSALRVRRPRAHNPKRTHKRRRSHARRASAHNPKRTHKRRRSHRRNPGIPAWGIAALASVAGLASYAVLSAGSFALTKASGSLKNLERNKYIIAGAGLLGGLALGFVSPIVGAGVAAGSLITLIGSPVTIKLSDLISPSAPAKISGVMGANGIPYGMAGVFTAGGRPAALMGGVMGADGRPQFLGDPWAEGPGY